MSKKTLIVGDLHTKHHILEKVKELSKRYDKVIFLGDYVDDWGAIPEKSYNILVNLKSFWEEDIGKVVLCIGNHEASEGFDERFRASGYNSITANYVSQFFHQFPTIFTMAVAEQGFLISHAGVTKTWADKYLPNCQTPEDYARALNKSFAYYFDFNQPSPTIEQDEKIFNGLKDVGYYRGGNAESPSPLWADINELLSDPLPGINQIVGHSPVNTVLHYNLKGNELYFCDTHSLFSNKEPIGDSSLLTIEDGKLKKVSLDGNELPW